MLRRLLSVELSGLAVGLAVGEEVEAVAGGLAAERRLEEVDGVVEAVEDLREVRDEVWLPLRGRVSSAGGTGIVRSAASADLRGLLLLLERREGAPLGSVIGTAALLALGRFGRW